MCSSTYMSCSDEGLVLLILVGEVGVVDLLFHVCDVVCCLDGIEVTVLS